MGWGKWPVALAAAVLFASAASAARDATEAPDLRDGDWIKPADILFIGDSESLGYFGAQLYRSLATERDPRTGRALTVWSLWTCASDVTTWLRGGTSYCGIRTCNGAGECARDHGPMDRPGRIRYAPLTTYLDKVSPRLTVVSLGTNLLSGRGAFSYDWYLESAARLVRQIKNSGSACIWVGPPQVAEKTRTIADYERFSADLANTVQKSGCAYIDSTRLSDRRYIVAADSEGIHYQPKGEKLWEAGVWTALEPVLTARLTR